MTVAPTSTATARRIAALDVIRGIAIAGTLGTNIWIFTDPQGPAGLLSAVQTGTLAATVEAGLRFLANGKFLALLTLLFGIGLELQYRSALRRGGRKFGHELVRHTGEVEAVGPGERGRQTADRPGDHVRHSCRELRRRQYVGECGGGDRPLVRDDEEVSELRMLAAAAGLGRVRGDGVVIELRDAPPVVNPVTGEEQEENPGRVLDRDLQIVVNALWHAGAEAIAIRPSAR